MAGRSPKHVLGVPGTLRVLLVLAGAVLAAGIAGCTEAAVTPRGNPAIGEELVLEAGSGEMRGTRIEPACGMCHTMAAAELAGTTAPDLDALQPGYERVYNAVRRGPGAMPSYSDTLTDEQIHDIAAYISGAAGSVE